MPSDNENNYTMCPGHSRPIVSLSFSRDTQDGIFLLSASQDKKAMLWDGNNGDWIGTFSGHKGALSCCSMNQDGTVVATGSNDFSCKVWNAITGECLRTYEDKHIVRSVDLSKSVKYVAFGGKSNTLHIYDLKSSKSFFDFPFSSISDAGKDGIIKCAFSKTEEAVIYVLHSNGYIYQFDIEKKSIVKQVDLKSIVYTHLHQNFDQKGYESFKYTLTDLCVSQDSTLVAVCVNNYVCFFDAHLILSFIYEYNYQPESISINSNNSRCLLSTSTIINEYDLSNNELYHCYKGHSGNVRTTAYHPNTVVFASGSEDGCLRIWNHH